MILLARGNLLVAGKDGQTKSLDLEKYALSLKQTFQNLQMPADWIVENLLMTLEIKLRSQSLPEPVDDQVVHELITAMLSALGLGEAAAEYGRLNQVNPRDCLAKSMRHWTEAEIEDMLHRRLPVPPVQGTRLAWHCQMRLRQLGIFEATEDFIIQLATHLYYHNYSEGLVDPVTGCVQELQPLEDMPESPAKDEFPDSDLVQSGAVSYCAPDQWVFIPKLFWQDHVDEFTISLLEAQVLQPEPVLRTYPRMGLNVAMAAMDQQFLAGWASPLSCLMTMRRVAAAILQVLSKMQLAYAEVLDNSSTYDCQLVFTNFKQAIRKYLGPMKRRERNQLENDIMEMMRKVLAENAEMPVMMSFK